MTRGTGVRTGVVDVGSAVTAVLGDLLQRGGTGHSGLPGNHSGPQVVIGFGLFLIYSGFGTCQRKRLIEDTPTETVTSAAAGRTELEGRGYPIDEPVTRPFSDEECLLATYKIDEENDGDESGWKTVASGTIAPGSNSTTAPDRFGSSPTSRPR